MKFYAINVYNSDDQIILVLQLQAPNQDSFMEDATIIENINRILRTPIGHVQLPSHTMASWELAGEISDIDFENPYISWRLLTMSNSQ